jgi:Protein of unknown function (DUF3277)
MGTTRVYDPDQVSVVAMGIPITGGYADGEFLTIEMVSDAFGEVVGTDGEVTRSKSNDNRATIKIKLMQSSPNNTALSAVYNLDLLTPGGAGIGPFLVRDRQGTAIYTAAHCWIKKAPDVSMDRTATHREWTLMCSDMVRLDGNN